jgi:hypothetical protein
MLFDAITLAFAPIATAFVSCVAVPEPAFHPIKILFDPILFSKPI